MDATLSLGLPRMNVSGTLLEGIALWGELRPLLTKEALVERALRYCDLAVSQGLLFIRSHVDTSDPRLVTAEALIEVRERVAPYITRSSSLSRRMAITRGGGRGLAGPRAGHGARYRRRHSAFRTDMDDGRRSVEALCRIAAERGLRSTSIATKRRSALAPHRDPGGRNHSPWSSGPGCRLAPDVHALHGQLLRFQLIPLMAEAEINVIPNPLINIMLQGRHDTYPKRRGMTRVRELMAAGLNVSFGQDCTMDPGIRWGPPTC